MLIPEPTPLLQTKLHPPRVAHGPILRPHLFELLDRGGNDTLTLISAPPGYGKSVLLATWLDECKLSYGWVSLDDGDNEFGVFYSYLIEALQKQHCQSCHKLTTLANIPQLSDPLYLASLLTETMIDCGKPMLLILDDFHRIRNKKIHAFLSAWIQNPPPFLRLIILTRRDPPLPLNTLRSQGRLTEIRMQDLRFQTEETAKFLKPFATKALSEKTLKNLDRRLEGWAAGLRLVSLNLRYCKDADKFLGELEGSPQVVREYLMNEVLAQQPSPFRECLLKVAVLDRFCADLCKELCLSADPKLKTYCEEHEDGEFPLMPKLLESNLFMIALDDEGVWYRFHHLFQDFLLDRLRSESGDEFVASLRSGAARWYADEGLLEEAVAHCLKGNNPEEAAKILIDNRSSLFQQEQEVRLSHLIRLLPTSLVESEPELLLHQAWVMLEFLELHEDNILDRAEAMIKEMPREAPGVRQMRGEVHAMRCVQYYEITNSVKARLHIESALELLDEDQWLERGTVMLMQVFLLQMEGLISEAKAMVFAAFKDPSIQGTPFHTRLLAALCFMHWMEADLGGVKPALNELEHLGRKFEFPETIAHALWMKGVIHYEKNEVDEAEDFLTEVLEEYVEANVKNMLHSAFALALVYEAQSRPGEAMDIAKRMVGYAVELQSSSLLQITEGFQAEINLRQGRVAQASLWAKTFNQDPRHASYRFYVPHLTLAKIFIVEGTAGSLKKGLQLLEQLEEIYTKSHNKRVLIHVLALKALCLQKEGELETALEVLHQSIQMGQPGGFIRVYLDAGAELISLLNRLELDTQGLEYVRRILAGFEALKKRASGSSTSSAGASGGAAMNDPMVEVLTERELEVLRLLSGRLSNREIGERLFIAPGTVKRHTNTLYRKLNVHGRHDAVTKAQGLGLLPTS